MVRYLEKFDETDKKIISLLMEKPDMTQIAIANHLGLSQPAMYARIQRLRKAGIITRIVGVNLREVDLHMAKVEITAKEPWKIIDFFSKCPMFLNGFITSGYGHTSPLTSKVSVGFISLILFSPDYRV